MAPRAVLLDADGVVQENPQGWLEELKSRAAHGDGQEFVDDLFSAEGPAMTGDRTFPEVLAEVARRWRLTADVEELMQHWRRIEVSQATLELVAELRGHGVGCYLASNQNSYRADYMRTSLGYGNLFDGEFYSCELGAMKSDPDYFTRVLRTLHLSPPDVLLVDDKEKYVDAARVAGLRAELWGIEQGIADLRARLADHGLPVSSAPSG